MRHFAHSAGDPGRGRAVALRLLTGLFLVLLWTCAGCGGGGDEQAEPAAGGSRMVPQGTEPAAGEVADSTSAAVEEAVLAEPVAPPEQAATTDTVPAESGEEPEAAATTASEPERTPAPGPEAAPEAGNLQTGGEYSLQLGSFRARANAEARAQLVRDTGYAPEIVSVVVGETTYHRVMIRGLAGRSTAERVGRELKDLLGIDYLVKKSG